MLPDGAVCRTLRGRRWVAVATEGRRCSLHRAVVAQCCLADDPPWQPTQKVNVPRVAAVPEKVVRQLLGQVRQPHVRASVTETEGNDLTEACVVVVDEPLHRPLSVGGVTEGDGRLEALSLIPI